MAVKKFYDYLVYSDGRIYSNLTNKFLKPDCYSAYAKVTLRIDGNSKRFTVHRLTAYLFCNPPDNYSELDADHLDGNHFIASRCFSGKRNSRYRFEIHDIHGREYMMSELAALTGKSLSWVYNRIVKFLNGEDIPEFKNCGIISVVDLKGKVNRLSKAERQVE